MASRSQGPRMHQTLFLLLVLVALYASSAFARLTSRTLLRAPSVPVQLLQHVQRAEQAQITTHQSPFIVSRDVAVRFAPRDKPEYQAYTFNQLVSHLDSVPAPVKGQTFKQRYWMNAKHYKRGGPVFLLDAGETNGEARFPFLRQGILEILSKAHNGIGIILEHRYYGESFPVKNLTTDSMRFLSTEQSLLDAKNFKLDVKLPGVAEFSNNLSPWIYYGGSYAGAKAAFARRKYPSTFWGGIVSSGVIQPIINFHEYYEPIRKSAPRKCMKLLITHTNLIDQLLDLNNYTVTSTLKGLFGLPNVSRSDDFVNTLALPLGSWQERNWDPAVGSKDFDIFCDAVTSSKHVPISPRQAAVLQPPIKKIKWASATELDDLAKYARFIRTQVASSCPYCTEYGFFITSSPNANRRLVSKRINLKYSSEICHLAFPPGKLVSVPKTPQIKRIERYGGLAMKGSRLAFVDGSEDPWLYATRHSSHAKKRPDTLSGPYKLIEGGVHHWDENGRPKGEPKIIREIHAEEIKFVGHWIDQWNARDPLRPFSPSRADLPSSPALIPYLPPHPQQGTPYHRYTLVLLEQKQALGLAPEAVERTDFSVREFMRQNDLTASGMSFFRQKWDEDVSTIYREILDRLTIDTYEIDTYVGRPAKYDRH
ncbi:BZ3500_MvSof-1268-A1-R1_Chr11-1g03276 [Microbotryum saponariae]|uniref:BZ3500_MvSof-1268-A1-R1_Chr11-1g03276 protein n=1 Tax=Microbotryum saponariae TaxID=289078 RepID=A0A2X0NDA9_9BASI|nr:BZ3501_MvSof-1269-A2-R1_Chr11g02851 [Microbotryum saponariae]SDA03867.1 BZ3500_MvSof-1268-A1-R1_Chr11-1g03276 [Microbotryum saponariae]